MSRPKRARRANHLAVIAASVVPALAAISGAVAQSNPCAPCRPRREAAPEEKCKSSNPCAPAAKCESENPANPCAPAKKPANPCAPAKPKNPCAPG